MLWVPTPYLECFLQTTLSTSLIVPTLTRDRLCRVLSNAPRPSPLVTQMQAPHGYTDIDKIKRGLNSNIKRMANANMKKMMRIKTKQFS